MMSKKEPYYCSSTCPGLATFHNERLHTMNTPDQPTGMNELREILEDARASFNLARDPGDNEQTFERTEAAIQEIVERCIPVKRKGDIRFGTKGERTFHESDYDRGCNYAIDQFRHNLQQAGLLRGDEERQ